MTDFIPCPTCGRYSHSIEHADVLAAAFNHFQSMFSHRGDGIPTQHSFDETTRDAAAVLMEAARAFTTQPTTDAALVAAVQKAIEDMPYLDFETWAGETLRPQTLREFYEGTYQGGYADELFPAVARVAVQAVLGGMPRAGDAMANCLQECADDLEAELLAKETYTTPVKMARDMEPVVRAKAMLAAREAG